MCIGKHAKDAFSPPAVTKRDPSTYKGKWAQREWGEWSELISDTAIMYKGQYYALWDMVEVSDHKVRVRGRGRKRKRTIYHVPAYAVIAEIRPPLCLFVWFYTRKDAKQFHISTKKWQAAAGPDRLMLSAHADICPICDITGPMSKIKRGEVHLDHILHFNPPQAIMTNDLSDTCYMRALIRHVQETSTDLQGPDATEQPKPSASPARKCIKIKKEKQDE